MQKKTHIMLIIFLMISIFSALPARDNGVKLPEIHAVSIVGNLTNWNPADTDNRMGREGDVWRRTLHLAPGKYEFKLALNDNWSFNFGGRIGKPLQPKGNNIIFYAPIPAAYTFTFSPNAQTLWVDRRPPQQPIAVIRAPSEWGINQPLTINGQTSVSSADHFVQSFLWRVETNDPAGVQIKDAELTQPEFTACFSAYGWYEIILDISDGKSTATARHRLKIGPSVQLVLAEPGPSQPSFHNMTPLPHADEFQWIWRAKQSGNQTVLFTLDHMADPIWGDSQLGDTSFSDGLVGKALTSPHNAPIPFPVEAGRLYEVRFNHRTHEYAISAVDYVEITFDPQHYQNQLSNQEIWQVDVGGDWNNWQTEVTPLALNTDGRWQTYLDLPPALYHYKIRVNQEMWLEDLNADPRWRVDDLTGQGSFNSGILVGESGLIYGLPQPNQINLEAIAHDPNDTQYVNGINPSTIELTIRTLANDLDRIELNYLANGWHSVGIERLLTRFDFDFFRIQLALTTPNDTLKYYLNLVDGTYAISLGAAGLATQAQAMERPFTIGLQPKIIIPEWAQQTVWYNIFPDRFRNGTPENDPTMNEFGQAWFDDLGVPFSLNKWTADWEVLEPWEQAYTERKEKRQGENVRYARHYGGDLQGVIEKMDYLANLGINGIWFNPIHYSDSNHKYDASSFHHVDPTFGFVEDLDYLRHNRETADPSTWRMTRSDSLFFAMVNHARKKGIRVIIDGVFNHTSNEFWAFEQAVQGGPNSPYADWYFFEDWTGWHPDSSFAWNKTQVKYEAWWNYFSMPNLNTRNAAVRQYIFAATRYWLDPDSDPTTADGVDGFRLDAANEIEPDFWVEWRNVVDATKPDVYTTGELWSIAPDWVQGDRFSALMNYPWLKIALRFFRDRDEKITVSEFSRRLAELRFVYPTQVNRALQNLTGSHDMDRLLSGFINPDRELDAENYPRDGYRIERPGDIDPKVWEKIKLFYLFQMTYVGAPLIYYGDEIGMYGADDPHSRKPMLWYERQYENGDRPNLDLYHYLQNLITIRHHSPAFSSGTIKDVIVDDDRDVYGYRRSAGAQSFLIVINNGTENYLLNQPVSNKKKSITDILNRENYPVTDNQATIVIAPQNGVILDVSD